MRVQLPWPDKALSPNARMHHMAKAKIKKAARKAGYYATRETLEYARLLGNDALHLSVVFNPPDKHRRDLDNMLASCKSHFDGIADCLVVDDSKWEISMKRGEPIKGGAVIVEIEPIQNKEVGS